MRRRTAFIYISWALLLIALSALSGAAYLSYDVLAEARVRAQIATDAEQMVTRRAYNERLRSLAAETEESRARLDAIAGHDVVSIVDMIEGVGEATGVVMRVSSALSGGDGTDLPGGTTLRPVVFVLEAEGSYAEVNHAILLLEAMPLPSSIDQIALQRGSEEGTTRWFASIRFRVHTTTNISS